MLCAQVLGGAVCLAHLGSEHLPDLEGDRRADALLAPAATAGSAPTALPAASSPQHSPQQSPHASAAVLPAQAPGTPVTELTD
jgi:hypothetical protein